MILLDTGAWLAWTSAPTRLSPKALKLVAEAEKQRAILVSAISVWEVSTLVAEGRLVLDRDVRGWLSYAASYPGLRVMPLDPIDALESTLLPGDPPDDPADRMLLAMARRLECPLVTTDRTLRAYRHVKTIG